MIPSRQQSTSITSSMAADKKRTKPFLWFVFFFYLLVLVYFLFFAETMGRGAAADYHYNLVPLQEIRRFWRIFRNAEFGGALWKISVLNLFGNVLAFVPLGYFLPKLIERCRNGFLTVLLCMEMSLCAEVIQLFFKLGSCDVDDLLLNTLGGLLGFILYWIVKVIEEKRV